MSPRRRLKSARAPHLRYPQLMRQELAIRRLLPECYGAGLRNKTTVTRPFKLYLGLIGFALAWNAIAIDVVKRQNLLPLATYYLGDVAILSAVMLSLLRGRLTSLVPRNRPLRIVGLLILALILEVIVSSLINNLSLHRALLGARWLFYPLVAWTVLGLPLGALDRLGRVILIALLSVSFLVELPVSLWQLATFHPLPAPEFAGTASLKLGLGVRAYGTMGWPTTLALSLLPLIVLLLVCVRSRRRAIYLTLASLLLVATFSRGEIAAGVAIAMSYLLLRTREPDRVRSWRRVPRWTWALLAVALVGAVFLLQASGLAARARDLSLTNFNRGVIAGGRLGIAHLGIMLLADHPLWGTGPGTFGGGEAVPTIPYINHLANAPLLTAESSLLQFSVEQGVLGLLILVSLLGGIAYLAIRHQRSIHARDHGAAVLALVGLLVASLSTVDFLVRQAALPLWLIIGISLARLRAASANEG